MSIPGARQIVPSGPAERIFLAVSGLLFAGAVAGTIGISASMSGMGEMSMPGGWTMSMLWMPTPGQPWPSDAAAFVVMWLLMMVAMMGPRCCPHCGDTARTFA